MGTTESFMNLNRQYLDPSETLRHEPLVYQCKNYIVAHQGKCVSAEVLVRKFLGEFTKGKETKVRQALETYANDLLFDKIIISLHDGYLHPFKHQEAYVKEYFRVMDKTARSVFYRLGNQIKRVKLEGQYKEVLGQYDKPIFEAYTQDYIELEEEPRVILPKLPMVEIYDMDEPPIIVPTQGQIGMAI